MRENQGKLTLARVRGRFELTRVRSYFESNVYQKCTILLRLLRQNYMFFKLFFYVEEAEWAIEVMKATGKPVAMCMCVCTAGDMEEVPIDECAVRIAKAGTWNFFQIFMH